MNPVKGSDQRGIRPVVIVIGNAMNDNFDICIVCQFTSTIRKYAGTVLIPKDDENNLEFDLKSYLFRLELYPKIAYCIESAEFQIPK